MNYVDNGALISAFNDRVAALNTKIANLTDGSTTNVVIENTSSNVLLSALSLDSVESPSGVMTLGNPEVVSNEQAPGITIETPTLVIEPEMTEETTEDTGNGVDQEQEETTEEETVEENTEDEVVEDEITEE